MLISFIFWAWLFFSLYLIGSLTIKLLSGFFDFLYWVYVNVLDFIIDLFYRIYYYITKQ